MTCMGYPGTTLDKVELDAETFAEWKVDMLKLDGCYSTDAERAEGEFMPGWTIMWRGAAAVGLSLPPHPAVAVSPNPSPTACNSQAP